MQFDQNTDVSQCCQLLVFVRFLDEDSTIKEELLLIKDLDTTSKGTDVMKIISDYFEKHDVKWENLAGFCTDGAPSMLGSRLGLATLVKEKKRSVFTTHCIIYRQALASKTLPEELAYTLKLAVKMVNTVKSSALNTRLFLKNYARTLMLSMKHYFSILKSIGYRKETCWHDYIHLRKK